MSQSVSATVKPFPSPSAKSGPLSETTAQPVSPVTLVIRQFDRIQTLHAIRCVSKSWLAATEPVISIVAEAARKESLSSVQWVRDLAWGYAFSRVENHRREESPSNVQAFLRYLAGRVVDCPKPSRHPMVRDITTRLKDQWKALLDAVENPLQRFYLRVIAWEAGPPGFDHTNHHWNELKGHLHTGTWAELAKFAKDSTDPDTSNILLAAITGRDKENERAFECICPSLGTAMLLAWLPGLQQEPKLELIVLKELLARPAFTTIEISDLAKAFAGFLERADVASKDMLLLYSADHLLPFVTMFKRGDSHYLKYILAAAHRMQKFSEDHPGSTRFLDHLQRGFSEDEWKALLEPANA